MLPLPQLPQFLPGCSQVVVGPGCDANTYIHCCKASRTIKCTFLGKCRRGARLSAGWLLRESSESEAEEEEEDSRFKEMEAEIRELKQFVPCSLQLLAERAIVLRFTKKSLLAVWHTRPNSKARS